MYIYRALSKGMFVYIRCTLAWAALVYKKIVHLYDSMLHSSSMVCTQLSWSNTGTRRRISLLEC